MSADLTKREVCKQSQQQLKTPMIPGDETILIPIVANFFATGGSKLRIRIGQHQPPGISPRFPVCEHLFYAAFLFFAFL